MTEKPVNILVTSFPGLHSPATLSFTLPSATSIRDLRSKLVTRLPDLDVRYIVTTPSGEDLSPARTDPISSLLFGSRHDFLPIRVTVPLRGGKGGFGSQLRAAGGRMASRKRRNEGENSGSSRNLDGRRLRTVTEAKALAEYLTVKPEMENREKEARRKRWQNVVEMAEKKEDEIRHGRRGKVDGQWSEDKEEAVERTREAVCAAMQRGNYTDNSLDRVRSSPDSLAITDESVHGNQHAATGIQTTPPGSLASASVGSNSRIARYFGFDDEDLGEEEEEDTDELSSG